MEQVHVDDRKLGQYLMRTRKIAQPVLDKALEIQKELPFLRLGEVLLGLKAIAFKDLTEALYNQFSEALFGHILVRRGVTTYYRLQEALELQLKEGNKRRVGEILISMGEATQQQIEEALQERELYHEYRFRLGFNRYFEDDSVAIASESAMVDSMPPGWAQELAALDPNQPARWLPGEGPSPA